MIRRATVLFLVHIYLVMCCISLVFIIFVVLYYLLLWWYCCLLILEFCFCILRCICGSCVSVARVFLITSVCWWADLLYYVLWYCIIRYCGGIVSSYAGVLFSCCWDVFVGRACLWSVVGVCLFTIVCWLRIYLALLHMYPCIYAFFCLYLICFLFNKLVFSTHRFYSIVPCTGMTRVAAVHVIYYT